MSSSLHWRQKLTNEAALPDDLKRILAKNGSFPASFDVHQVDYLRGLQDAGVEGAKVLLQAILKHKEVELFLLY